VTLGNAPAQDAELQRLSAEGIGIKSDNVAAIGPKLPVRFAALIVHRNTVDRRVTKRRKTEVERQAIQRFETFRIGLQHFVLYKSLAGGIGAKIDFQP